MSTESTDSVNETNRVAGSDKESKPVKNNLRVAVFAFGQTFYQDELSDKAWSDLTKLVRDLTRDRNNCGREVCTCMERQSHSCCGCTCHVCKHGHESGKHPHTKDCEDSFFGDNPNTWNPAVERQS